jgi:hypothetical protein
MFFWNVSWNFMRQKKLRKRRKNIDLLSIHWSTTTLPLPCLSKWLSLRVFNVSQDCRVVSGDDFRCRRHRITCPRHHGYLALKEKQSFKLLTGNLSLDFTKKVVASGKE